MSDNSPKFESSITALIIGQGAECDILKSHLQNNPTVTSVVHQTGGHHSFQEIRSGHVNTIFIDPYSVNGGLDEATYIIFHVRLEFPEIVFVLYLDDVKIATAEQDLFTGEDYLSSHLKTSYNDLFIKERSRLSHYFRLSKNILDPNFSNFLDSVLRSCSIWHQTVSSKHSGRAVYDYDVALSFAGEDRILANDIADELRLHGVRVFYDSFEQANLWGKDLFAHLHEIYSKKSRFCIMLVSAAYSQKMWTIHERRSAQSRALNERDNEYILPVKIDNTQLPGLPDTISYIDISQYGYLEICRLFIQKLGGTLSTFS
jgi:hypothetical protein